MKFKIFLSLSALLCSAFSYGQIISIASAHAQPIGSTVSVTGIAVNGSELGVIRYIQDATGGIAVYDPALSSVQRGDEVTVTGVLDDYYNLLEINPVNSFTNNSSGNTLPVAQVVTPVQLGESYESELVRIDNATFVNAGSLFAANTNYDFITGGQSGTVRIGPVSPLIGQTVPSVSVSVVGFCSQFLSFYQLVPRDLNDIFINATISIVNQPMQNNISSSGFDVSWTTNIAGTSAIKYGHTPSFELGTLTGTGGSLAHTVNISGAAPSDLYYVKAYSVDGADTAFADTKIFITVSASSGIIKAYFNRTVNNSVANPSNNLAIRVNNKIADTLAAYIDRAQTTLDIAIYTYGDVATNAITQAINNAYNRGVSIRIISDGGNVNAGLAGLNTAIPRLLSPTGASYTIMHNKFVIIDANAGDANLPIVWTGSTNWTDEQLNTDANNVIVFQDKSLAKAYTLEFNEMWGSTSSTPNAVFSRFGSYKTDNTPHEFLIGGKRVECYFSPSDFVNDKIVRTANTADNSLYFAVFAATRYDIAYPIADRINNNGVFVAGMVDDSSGSGGSFFTILYNEIGNRMMEYNHSSLPGLLHHKYMIVDQENSSSDPLVLTGSHNWSTNATTLNDENTVVVHDGLIANQYYQEFYQRYVDNGGIGLSIEYNQTADEFFYISPNPATDMVNLYIKNEKNSKLAVDLYDINGRKKMERTIVLPSGMQVASIPLNGLPAGMYFLKTMAGEKTFSKKIIIQK